MNRRLLALVLAAGCAASALVGCTDGSTAGPEPTPTSTPTATGSPTAETQTLRWSVYGEPRTLNAYARLAEDFGADRPGTRVVLQEHTDAASAAEDALADLSAQQVAEEASGSTEAPPTGRRPAPDVFLLDQHFLPDLVATGMLHPLDIDLEELGVDFGDDFQRIALFTFSAESALQCMPFEMSPTVLFVNRALVRDPILESRGIEPPEDDGSWSFEQFALATRAVVRANPDVDGLRAVHLPADADLLSAIIRTAGSDVVDAYEEPTELTVDNDDAREVLEAWISLARERRVTLSDRLAAREAPIDRFADGRLAFAFGTRADVPELRASGVRFDVLAVPGFGRPRTTSATSALCVNAESPHLEAAVEFVADAVSAESFERVARTGAFVPAHLEVVNSQAFEQPSRPPATVAPFIEGQKRTVPVPYSAGWRLAATRIEELVARLSGPDRRVDLEAALDTELPALDEASPEWFAPTEEE